jgi:hypothetical protein
MMRKSTTHRFFGAQLLESIDAASSDGHPSSSAFALAGD